MATKYIESGYIEILCSEHYPITLNYDSRREFMTFVIDYRTHTARADDPTIFESFKPGLRIIIRSKKN